MGTGYDDIPDDDPRAWRDSFALEDEQRVQQEQARRTEREADEQRGGLW